MFQTNRRIKGFIAYRLPFSDEVHVLTGDVVHVATTTPFFIVHPFNGYPCYLENLVACSLNDFPLASSSLQIETPRQTYTENFNVFHEAMTQGSLDKIILSKLKRKTTQKDGIEIFNALNTTYKNTFNYWLIHPKHGVWMGATPEKLAIVKDSTFYTTAIAGTKPLDTPREWTKKEIQEHQFVIDFIQDAIKTVGLNNAVQDNTVDLIEGKVMHLKTDISVDLPIDFNPEVLVNALHPTPATCGLPQNSAKELILKTELHHRKLYTGYLGIKNHQEQHYFVNLRCMELSLPDVQLYLGGGLTKDSDLEQEWIETENKGKTLLDLL